MNTLKKRTLAYIGHGQLHQSEKIIHEGRIPGNGCKVRSKRRCRDLEQNNLHEGDGPESNMLH